MRSSEPVPDAPHRGQWQPVAELLAELSHVDVHRAVVSVPVGTPHAVEELAPAQRQASMLRKVLQEVELACGERNDLAAPLDLATVVLRIRSTLLAS